MPNQGSTGNLRYLLAWARKQKHPFTACMRSKELTAKVPDPKQRAKICARLKDRALGTESWRKGRGG